MARKINWASSAIEQQTVPDSLSLGAASRSFLNQERWSEHFQDLSGYCNIGSKMADSSAQQSGEQLNTPNIIVQDEFDFGLRSSEKFDVFDESDPWEASSAPIINTTQTQLWENVTDWLSASNQPGINNQEDIVDIDIHDIDTTDKTPFDTTIDKKQIQQQEQLIKSDRDFLLSQSSSDDYKILLPENDITKEHSYIDLVSILKEEPFNNKCNSLQEQEFVTAGFISNNNINMNNALTSNNNSNKIDNSNCFPVKSQLQSDNEHDNLVLPTSLSSSLMRSKADLLVNSNNNNNNYHFNKNRRDPVNIISKKSVNLSSMFKSEEPLIGESRKPFSSCTTINNNTYTMANSNNDSVKVAAIIIAPKVESTTYNNTSTNNNCLTTSSIVKKIISFDDKCEMESSSKMSDEYIIPDSIKTEPMDTNDMEVESINEHNLSTVNIGRNVRKHFKIPPNNLNKKPGGLKLDIDSATKLVTTGITPTSTPTAIITTVCGDTGTLSTPDVLRQFMDVEQHPGEFNLLSYMNEDGVKEFSGPNVLSTSGNNSPVVEFKKNFAVIKPFQQNKQQKSKVVVEKCESAMYEGPSLTVVKEEQVDDDDYDDKVADQSVTNIPEINLPTKQKQPVRRTASKRRRIVKKSEDMESDLSNLSDFAEEDDEEHDRTFQLTPYRRKRTISNASRSSTSTTPSSSRRKMSRETDSSDHESIASSADRYRELRDRNNEASRRSRLNRKSRESDMKHQALKLEQENRRLKAKADEMERLVKRLREGLMQLVLKKR